MKRFNQVLAESDYIELKKNAYDLYRKYGNLQRNQREEFLNNLPDFGSEYANLIVKSTILIPDTPELISVNNPKIISALKKIKDNEDFITDDLVWNKMHEYSFQKTAELIKTGQLTTMPTLSEISGSISDKEYISLKEECLNVCKQFRVLPLVKRDEFVQSICNDEMSYQNQIQLATLLIPDDAKLVLELKEQSTHDLALKYNLPLSLIKFKEQEYFKQGTEELIAKEIFPKSDTFEPWDKRDEDVALVSKIWPQTFYENIETNAIEQIKNNLNSYYKDDSIVKTGK